MLLFPTDDDHDQLIVNELLQKIRFLDGKFRWGIYNPLLVYTGMYRCRTPVSLRVHHATSSVATLSDKRNFLDSDFETISNYLELCAPAMPPYHGPQDALCLYLSAEDLHAESELETAKLFDTFGPELIETLLDRPIWRSMQSDRDTRERVLQDEFAQTLWRHDLSKSWVYLPYRKG